MNKILEFISKNKTLSLLVVAAAATTLANAVIDHNNSHRDLLQEKINALEAQSVKEVLTLEVGRPLPTVEQYFETKPSLSDKAAILYLKDGNEQRINSICKENNDNCDTIVVDKYDVLIKDGDKEYKSTLDIVDTKAPEVETKSQTIQSGDKYDIKGFIAEYKDNNPSMEYTATYERLDDSIITSEGNHKIKIKVCDPSNNCTSLTVELIINAIPTPSQPSTPTTPSKPSNPSKPKTPSKPSTPAPPSNPGTQTPTTTTVEEKVILSSIDTYGTKTNKYVIVTYQVTNGKKTEISRTGEQTEVVYSYNGTTASLRAEAQGVYGNIGADRNTILNRTNAYRAEVGAGNLTVDYGLSVMAIIRTMEMAYSNTFSHTRPGGKSWDTVWDEYGYPKAYLIGENIGKGYRSADRVCDGWRNSQAHYENMINKTFTKIGIGKYTFNNITYWAQEFSS